MREHGKKGLSYKGQGFPKKQTERLLLNFIFFLARGVRHQPNRGLSATKPKSPPAASATWDLGWGKVRLARRQPHLMAQHFAICRLSVPFLPGLEGRPKGATTRSWAPEVPDLLATEGPSIVGDPAKGDAWHTSSNCVDNILIYFGFRISERYICAIHTS